MAVSYSGQTYESVIEQLVARIEVLEKKAEVNNKLIDMLVYKVAPEYKV